MPSGTGYDLGYTGEQINEAIGNALNPPIIRLENPENENPIYLRNLETGVYSIYGYAKPYEGSSHTLVFSDAIAHVARKDAGSHVMVFSPLNCIINFLEILVDETATGGHTYTRKNIKLAEMWDTVNGLTDGIKLIDRTKGKLYTLYVDDGKLTLETEE